MRKVLTVAWREFKHTALTKAFFFAAIGLPGLIGVLLLFMPALMRPNVTPLEGTIVVVAADSAVAGAARSELSGERLRRRLGEAMDELAEGPESPADAARDPDAEVAEMAAVVAGAATPRIQLDVELVDPREDPSGEWSELKDRVRRGELVALAVVPDDSLATGLLEGGRPTYQLFVPPGFPPNHTMLLRGAIAEAVARARAERAGIDFDAMRALVRPAAAEVRRLETGGGEVREQVIAKLLIPIAFMMLLWMSVFVSANYLLTTTIEEKSSKVMEVLLSAVSPMQLMGGKIIGQGMVSAVMLLAYGGVGLVALVVMASMALVPAHLLVYLAIYYVMAYFMIASMMAGVGSAANDMHEAQSLIGPAMVLLMVPLMLWFPISENPNGWLATITSFIPPVIPFVMILRVTAANEPVPAWQIVLSIVWGYAAMVGMIWMASRIFRVGVLMQGKTPTPRELVKWLAYR